MSETLHVLAVDDEEGMRLGVQRVLRNYAVPLPEFELQVAFDVELAASGEEAIERLGAKTYDLVLLDHKMPGLSGLDVLAWLHEREQREKDPLPSPLTIMVTAYASLETAVEAIKRGAFDFIAKPFTPAEMRSTVSKAATHLMAQRQARKLAEEKRRLRFEFISVLAHELKAPLNSIDGYLQIVKGKTAGDDPEAYERIIDRCIVRLDGMRKLIYDLLDLTRIESGSKRRDLVSLDLVALTRNSIETVLPDAQSRGIEIELSGPETLEYTADQSEIEILLNNLISNAVKYNRDDGHVWVRWAQSPQGYRIEVQDTGIGMSEAESARLFKEFVRIKNRKTTGILGSGLGLSTVKKLVELYGGQVGLESTPDVGSTFFIDLPLGSAADQDSAN